MLTIAMLSAIGFAVVIIGFVLLVFAGAQLVLLDPRTSYARVSIFLGTLGTISGVAILIVASWLEQRVH